MKQLCAVLLTFALLFAPSFYIPAYAMEPDVLISQAAILMDADTGQVLYDKDMTQKMYPASMTKILTALLAVEICRPYEIITVNRSALADIFSGHSHIALVPGEELSVDDALYALMLSSANDAANVLAEHTAGTIEAFVVMMNAKAREIGAVNSNFTNPHGFHDDNHYSTAYDMALITRYAMQNETFRHYFGAERHIMPATNLKPERHLLNYQYYLLEISPFYNPDVIGGKTGFTDAAQNTLSSVASRDGRTLVCVVMDSPVRGDKFRDTEKLLNFGFDEFVPVSISGDMFSGFELPIMEGSRTVGSAVFTANRDFSALIHNTMRPEDIQISHRRPEVLEKGGDIAYNVVFELPGAPAFMPKTLGVLNLDAEMSFPLIPEIALGNAESSSRFSGLLLTRATYGLIIFGSAVLLFGLFVLFRRYRVRKRRRDRQERLNRLRKELGIPAYTSYISRPATAARPRDFVPVVSRSYSYNQRTAKY